MWLDARRLERVLHDVPRGDAGQVVRVCEHGHDGSGMGCQRRRVELVQNPHDTASHRPVGVLELQHEAVGERCQVRCVDLNKHQSHDKHQHLDTHHHAQCMMFRRGWSSPPLDPVSILQTFQDCLSVLSHCCHVKLHKQSQRGTAHRAVHECSKDAGHMRRKRCCVLPVKRLNRLFSTSLVVDQGNGKALHEGCDMRPQDVGREESNVWRCR